MTRQLDVLLARRLPGVKGVFPHSVHLALPARLWKPEKESQKRPVPGVSLSST